MNPVRRRAVVAAVGLLAVTAGMGVAFSRGNARTATAAPATATTRVTRADLATTRQFAGTLGYPAAVPVVAATAGRVYTRLPAPGDVITQGQTLYEVDGTAVPLLYGDRPAWRTLEPGTPAGPDVAQLNTALGGLGHAHGVTGNPHFTSETGAAVRRWQRAHGWPVTGVVEPGAAVFAPGPLRVQAVHASVGAPPRPGEPLLDATATTHVVNLPVPVDQAYLIHLHDAATVTLPDGKTTTPGTVSAISPVAVQPVGATDRSQPSTPVIDVTVSLADPAAAAAYTSAPITVAVTTAEARGVLAVPVTALLARPDGGFAVTVVDGAGRHEVPVRAGLFAQTLVEVSGSGIAEGTVVEVPAS
jgi:hypothetical protein